MTKNTKVNAAILIIGNEILSGRTQDTNTSSIALWLNSIGVTVNEVRVIPDIEGTIVDTECLYTSWGVFPVRTIISWSNDLICP